MCTCSCHLLLQCNMTLYFSLLLALSPLGLIVSLHCNAQWCTCSCYQFTAIQNNIAVLHYLFLFLFIYLITRQCTDVHLQLYFTINFKLIKILIPYSAWSVVNIDISKVLWFYKLPKLPANRAVIMQDTGSYARSGKTFKVKERANSQLTDVAG